MTGQITICTCVCVRISSKPLHSQVPHIFAPLSMYRPNVCADEEMTMLGGRQPCVQAFTRRVKVWKQGCSDHRWCLGYERR